MNLDGRVAELDAGYISRCGYFYGTIIPLAHHAGGNPDWGRSYYLKNIERNPNFLMTKLYYARYYAVQVQDKELFDNLLTEIETFDLESAPEIRLFNALAKQKAINLRQNAELFLDLNEILETNER